MKSFSSERYIGFSLMLCICLALSCSAKFTEEEVFFKQFMSAAKERDPEALKEFLPSLRAVSSGDFQNVLESLSEIAESYRIIKTTGSDREAVVIIEYRTASGKQELQIPVIRQGDLLQIGEIVRSTRYIDVIPLD